ncbi:cytidine deaminase [Shewanella surugensis]|uniref:Cytidine deaminase n=1 Tax=Shewanella surugensis TaxID=212020 RepID=A0ABT0L926_9GAMM|nr:cytidine deaminase [Shewanella surugensis]MCL1124196.1 cytidine deaminase [Shewanella surugensis]
MQDRFIEPIKTLSNSLANALTPLLDDRFSGYISASQRQKLMTVTQLDEAPLLLQLLPIAAALSKPTISHFYVGAIAKGASGDIYMGANIELQGKALFHSVHAEQSAISHAWLKGEKYISDIIVNASPCGHCRQFMNELVKGHAINIHLPKQTPKTLTHYLPYAFGPSDLNVQHPLLSPQYHPHSLDSDDPIMQVALEHASKSYAPYTQNHAAVILETVDGKQYSSRYAENAAFNPSMLPMQMALSAMVRHDQDFSDITRAILVESSKGKVSLIGATTDALNAVSNVELEHKLAIPA